MENSNREANLLPEASNDSRVVSPFRFLLVALIWTLTIAGLGYWHYDRVAAGYLQTAMASAIENIEKDKIYRLWASQHGGVYVPATDKTPPNPYLAHVPERDIITPSERPLTLINPAYMTRQVHEFASERFGTRANITSLNPLRPDNSPDEWEVQALRSFDAAAKNYSSLEVIDGEKFLRVMSPFYAEALCLGCHGAQGYQVGDLIGGIGVAIPWRPYQQAHQSAWVGYGFGYGGIWILGLVLLEGHRRRLRHYLEQQHQSEQHRRELLERLQKLATHLPGMIYQFQLHQNGTSRLPYTSDAIYQLYGVDPTEANTDATAIFAVVHPADRDEFSASIQHSAKFLTEWRSQHRVMHPSGHMIWVEAQSTPERLADGSVLWHGFAQDITERKQAEELLENQKKQLEQRNKALKQFNYTVSHELKTPLVTIESSLGMIQNTLSTSADSEQAQAFGYARQGARQMNRLLDSLLLMFRIDARDDSADVGSWNLLAQEAVDRLNAKGRLQGVHLSIAPEGPLLAGDRDKFIQLWQHLIGNAAKFMGDQPDPTIEVGVEQREQETLFYVRDNGIGIEQPYQARIFDLFDQLDKDAEGMGLGLTLVQRIVDYYGGTIRVESAGKGQGSCFYFTLPDALIKEGAAA